MSPWDLSVSIHRDEDTSAIYLAQFLGVCWGSIIKPSYLHSQHLPLWAISITPGWDMMEPLMINLDEVRCLGECTWNRCWNLGPSSLPFSFSASVGILLLFNLDVLYSNKQYKQPWTETFLFISCFSQILYQVIMNSYEFHSENHTTRLLPWVSSAQLCGHCANVLRVGLQDVEDRLRRQAVGQRDGFIRKVLASKHEDLNLSSHAEDVFIRTGHGGAFL